MLVLQISWALKCQCGIALALSASLHRPLLSVNRTISSVKSCDIWYDIAYQVGTMVAPQYRPKTIFLRQWHALICGDESDARCGAEREPSSPLLRTHRSTATVVQNLPWRPVSTSYTARARSSALLGLAPWPPICRGGVRHSPLRAHAQSPRPERTFDPGLFHPSLRHATS